MTGSAKARAERRAAQVARINEISQLARTAWFALLGYLVFVGITLLGVEDADFFVPSRRTQLPLANVEIPTASFFWTAPILGAALYTYLHLFLIKLWDAHGEARTRDSDPTHHWLVNDFVLIRQRDPVARARPLAWLTFFITRLLVWVAGPFVLAYAWWRSMPAHDEWLTLTIAACLGVTLFVGFTSWGRAEARLRPWRTPWWRGWHKWTATATGAVLLIAVSWLRTEGGLDHHVNRMIDLADAAFGTALLKDCAVYGEDGAPISDRLRDDCLFPNGDPKPAAEVQRLRIAGLWWIPRLDWFTLSHEHWLASIWLEESEIWTPLARTDLEGIEVVEVPDAWRTPETAMTAFREIWCRREGLDMAVCGHMSAGGRSASPMVEIDRTQWCLNHEGVGSDECFGYFEDLDERFEKDWWEERDAAIASLPELNLATRDLRNAVARRVSLVGADLSGVRLERADIFAAKLESAILRNAQLEGANLADARLDNANLIGTRLRGANLTNARMEGVFASEADLEGANLSNARMEHALAPGVRMTDALLNEAWLSDAWLSDARLERAKLRGARLENAFLNDTRMDGADLSGAALVGAVLWGAHLDGASLFGASLQGADLRGATLDGADLTAADFRAARLVAAEIGASPVVFTDFRDALGLTQAQLDQAVGNEGTLLPDVHASDTGEPFYIWNCWEAAPPDLDRIVRTLAEAREVDPSEVRAELLCGPGNPRKKTGTPLAIDAPYPEGHPLADRDDPA